MNRVRNSPNNQIVKTTCPRTLIAAAAIMVSSIQLLGAVTSQYIGARMEVFLKNLAKKSDKFSRTTP
jgi:hypothetical protein